MLEPLDVPLMLADRGRIAIANAAAREQLGAHIVGQDVRIALRHPDAVALLDGEGSAMVPGLTGTRSIWQVSRRRIDDRFAMIELVNKTAEADIGRAHTDFVANASHELSTPLASIIGYVETLADDDTTVDRETAAKFQSVVLREARRLQSLVQDLMSLSRIEAEKHDHPRERVDLGKLAASVASKISAARGDGRVVIEWPKQPAIIAGDRSQLDQLLRNLIDNALKYGDLDAPVTVSVERAEDHVTLAVEDRGPGIAPEHLPHLTRRFYRTDPGRSRAAGGTGLGLAIVKHIVERHRGKLDIASRVGEGTTIKVILPIA
ncbi:MAG: ATP-binding protein [Novosphingobium sp.]|nr:ATP-binding protein [Novosphingobium sp.]